MKKSPHLKAMQVVIEKVTPILENLSEEELDLLIKKQFNIELDIKTKTQSTDNNTELIDPTTIVEKLKITTSIEEGNEYLDASCKTRTHLERVAKILEIMISKKDKASSIKEKILKSTIGARKNSDAIQGKSST